MCFFFGRRIESEYIDTFLFSAPCSGVDISYYTWFTKTDGTAGSLKLVNKAADGTEWCVDAGSTRTFLHVFGLALIHIVIAASGTRMKIWKCYDGLAAQTWVYNSATQQIKLNSANQCLDVVDGKYNDTGFTLLQTWTCTAGNTNQVCVLLPSLVARFMAHNLSIDLHHHGHLKDSTMIFFVFTSWYLWAWYEHYRTTRNLSESSHQTIIIIRICSNNRISRVI
jgi:hypothetical protein